MTLGCAAEDGGAEETLGEEGALVGMAPVVVAGRTTGAVAVGEGSLVGGAASGCSQPTISTATMSSTDHQHARFLVRAQVRTLPNSLCRRQGAP